MSLFTSAFTILARRLLGGGSSRLLGAAQTYLRRTMRQLVDEAEERLRKKALSYLASAVLAMVAAVSLAFAVAQGLTALGMPPWASHLVVAMGAGIACWICDGQARSERVIGTDTSDSESEPARRLTIKIVNEVRPARPRRRKRRVEPRPSRSGKVRRSKPRPRTKRRVRTADARTRRNFMKPGRSKRMVKTGRVRAA
jgi:hypothetical protein